MPRPQTEFMRNLPKKDLGCRTYEETVQRMLKYVQEHPSIAHLRIFFQTDIKKSRQSDLTQIMASLEKLKLVEAQREKGCVTGYKVTATGERFLISPSSRLLADQLLGLGRFKFLYRLFEQHGKLGRDDVLVHLGERWPTTGKQFVNQALSWLQEVGLIQKTTGGYKLAKRGDDKYQGLFDTLITHPRVRESAQPLFRIGAYAPAAQDAMQVVAQAVRDRIGPHQIKSDVDLMKQAFSATSPRLVATDPTGRSQVGFQEGVMNFMAGTFATYRNPMAHSVNAVGDPEKALKLLSLACLMMEIVDQATNKA